MIETLPAAADVPLCLNQEHLLLSREYFRDCGIPLSPSSVVTVLRLRGPLDFGALGQALNALVARHPSLRTRIIPCETLSPEQRTIELTAFGQRGVFPPGLYRQSVAQPAPVPLATGDETEIERLIAD